MLTVKLAGVDFVVVKRLERRGMAPGINRADVLVRVEIGLAQPIGREQMTQVEAGSENAKLCPLISATVFMPDPG